MKKQRYFPPGIERPTNKYEWDQYLQPQEDLPPVIYEAHIGKATTEEKTGT
jgi:hypothetical protein